MCKLNTMTWPYKDAVYSSLLSTGQSVNHRIFFYNPIVTYNNNRSPAENNSIFIEYVNIYIF